MRKVFILAFLSLIPSDLTLAREIDCNISDKQKYEIKYLLCGGLKENKGCFSLRFSSIYKKYVHENNYLRACGYSRIADDRESAILTYANRLEPLGQCIGEKANLHEIWSTEKEKATLDDAACTAARRTQVESMLPEIRKFIAALRDPEPATLRVYRNLGVLKD